MNYLSCIYRFIITALVSRVRVRMNPNPIPHVHVTLTVKWSMNFYFHMLHQVTDLFCKNMKNYAINENPSSIENHHAFIYYL